MSIAQSHQIDDLSIALGKARREAADALALLTDAQEALSAGRLPVVEEFLDRAVGHVRSITA